MNVRYSGRFPDNLKRFAVIAATLTLLLTGCKYYPDDTSSGDEDIISSEEESTHEPVSDDSGADSVSSSVGSSVGSSFIWSSSGTDSTSWISSSTVSSGNGSSDPVSTVSSESTVPDVSSSSIPPESSQTPISSSPVSSSEPISTPDTPPEIVIPEFPVPTSPGTTCAIGANGWIDYSNISKGYISAKYTGSSAKVKLKIICSGNSAPYNPDVPVDGTVEYYPLALGNGDYTIQLCERNANNKYTQITECKFSYSQVSSPKSFMYPNYYVKYTDSSACVYKAAELCAGKTGTIDKIAAIFGWVTSNVTYDYYLAETVQKGYVPDPDRTFNSRKGICFDYASLMCAMLRSQSIPSRLVVGYASPDIYHAWNEVYTEETGWITPELMLKKMGYNIVDSTFYASAKNKSQISSYISDASNYQAITYY